MSWLTDARDLPNHVFWLTLALLMVTLRLILLLLDVMPQVLVAGLSAVWTGVLYWGLAALFLRSDPRIWRPSSAWYRTNLQPLPAAERQDAQQAVRDVLAPRLRWELAVLVAVGAAVGAIGMGMAAVLALAVTAALLTWGIGAALGLGGAAS